MPPDRPADPTEPWAAPGVPREEDGRRTGVLVLHGSTGSPASVRPWAEHLNEAGYAVAVPRLPGPGTRCQDLDRTTYADWYGEAEAALEKLSSDCDSVVVAGLSMGGCLALDLAERRSREVAGLVLVDPVVSRGRFDGYARTPLRAVRSLFRAVRAVRERLPEVTQPLLLFRSRADRVADPSSGRVILATVSSRDLEERVLEDGHHVATLDDDAPAVFAGTVDFIRRVTAPSHGVGAA